MGWGNWPLRQTWNQPELMKHAENLYLDYGALLVQGRIMEFNPERQDEGL